MNALLHNAFQMDLTIEISTVWIKSTHKLQMHKKICPRMGYFFHLLMIGHRDLDSVYSLHKQDTYMFWRPPNKRDLP